MIARPTTDHDIRQRIERAIGINPRVRIADGDTHEVVILTPDIRIPVEPDECSMVACECDDVTVDVKGVPCRAVLDRIERGAYRQFVAVYDVETNY